MHKHHIIPKHEWKARFGTLTGVNEEDNIVLLSVAQHIECHQWLWEQFGRWQDEVAYKFLSNMLNKEELQREMGRQVGLSRRGVKMVCSEEHKRNVGVGLKKSKKFKQSMRDLGIKRRGISRSPEVGKKVSASKIGHTVSSEVRKRISESLKGRTGMKHSIVTCPHCQRIGGNNSMPRWHFDNCKERVVQ